MPADPAKIAAGWDISRKVFRYMDFANVQGYDFHGAGSDNSWEPNRTGHLANLYRDTDDPYPFEFSVGSLSRRTWTRASTRASSPSAWPSTAAAGRASRRGRR